MMMWCTGGGGARARESEPNFSCYAAYDMNFESEIKSRCAFIDEIIGCFDDRM